MKKSLFSLILLAGCHAAPWELDTTVSVDPTLPYEHQRAAWRAWVAWQIPGCPAAFVWTDDASTADRVIHNSTAPCNHNDWDGCYSPPDPLAGYDGGDIYYRVDMNEANIESVITHELGHALGFDHASHTYGPSVMFSRAEYHTVTTRDLAALADRLGCLDESGLTEYLTEDPYSL